MAQRKAIKPKQLPLKAVGKPGAPAPKSDRQLTAAVERLEERVSELKRERDELDRALAAARQQIATLEKARTDAINRIDWVIDSLHTILQDKS